MVDLGGKNYSTLLIFLSVFIVSFMSLSARLETLISEEAMLLAKFLRDERKNWNSRIPEAIPKTGGNQT